MVETFSETIGERLKRLRKENGYTKQSDLGKEIGASVTSISYWETGTHPVPSDILIKLRDLYGVSIDYMLCVSDYTRPENDYIGSETGLSEKSIEVLKRFKSENEDIFKENLKGLNYILESLSDAYNGLPFEKHISENEIAQQSIDDTYIDIRLTSEDIEKFTDLLSHSKSGELSGYEMYFNTFNELRKMRKHPDSITILRWMKYHYLIDHESMDEIINSPKEYYRVHPIPDTNTILSDIYRYTHIREYISSISHIYSDIQPDISNQNLWYSLNMLHLQDLLIKARDEISDDEFDKLTQFEWETKRIEEDLD